MMKKGYILIILAGLFIFSAFSQTPISDQHWTLYFEDQFNGTSVNTSKWNFSFPWSNCDGEAHQTSHGGNHEFSNGTIKLVSKKESSICSHWDGTAFSKPYTTGALFSKETFKYGYFEIRCKLPELKNTSYTGKGFAPGFWMWPLAPDSYYPYYDNPVTWSEIDFFEINAKNNLHSCNVHYKDIYFGTSSKWELRQNSDFDFTIDFNNFHKFSCEWTPNYISFYFDDKLIRTVHTDTARKLIPMNLIMGIATPAGNFLEGFAPNSLFPYKFEIDYVKVYKLSMDCYTDVSAAQFSYNTHDYRVKRNIVIGGSTGKVPNGLSVSLRATQSITLNDGFEVPLGSDFYANICKCED